MKRFDAIFYSCTKKGHRDCWSKKKSVKSNVAFSNIEIEEECDAKAMCVIEEDELALMAMMRENIDYEDD